MLPFPIIFANSIPTNSVPLDVLSKALLEVFKNVSAIAMICVGVWTLYKHFRTRTFQKKLILDIKTSSTPLNDKRVVFVEVELTNSGKSKLGARRTGPDDYVYRDKFEELKYPCSLQLRKIDTAKIADEASLNWYESNAPHKVRDVPAEINLLDEYIVPAEGDAIVFWMEPGDVVHLPAVLVLGPGDYLFKVSFYGSNPRTDFWNRMIYVKIA